MISTGCRDVQHTGLQSTQSRRNYRATTLVSKVHKQGASLNSQGVLIIELAHKEGLRQAHVCSLFTG